MTSYNTLRSVEEAYELARQRGAHTVRIGTDMLEVLLSGHQLLGAVMRRSIEKMDAAEATTTVTLPGPDGEPNQQLELPFGEI